MSRLLPPNNPLEKLSFYTQTVDHPKKIQLYSGQLSQPDDLFRHLMTAWYTIQLHSLQGLPPTQTRFPIPQGLCQNFPATFLASSGAKLQTGDASKVPKKKGWFLSLKVLTKRLHLNRVLSNCTWNWFNLRWCNPGYFLSLRANVHHVNRSSASVNHPSMPLRAPNIQMSTDLREQKDPFWCCQPSWSPEAMFQKDSQKVYDFFRKSDLTWLQFTPVCCFEIYLR